MSWRLARAIGMTHERYNEVYLTAYTRAVANTVRGCDRSCSSLLGRRREFRSPTPDGYKRDLHLAWRDGGGKLLREPFHESGELRWTSASFRRSRFRISFTISKRRVLLVSPTT